jgi:hypothetical protein
VRTSSATMAPELRPMTFAGLSVRREGHAPDIIGIGREPVSRVGGAVEVTPRKTTTVVRDHMIL